MYFCEHYLPGPAGGAVVAAGMQPTSSLASGQSVIPLHFWDASMQTLDTAQWNWESRQPFSAEGSTDGLTPCKGIQRRIVAVHNPATLHRTWAGEGLLMGHAPGSMQSWCTHL